MISYESVPTNIVQFAKRVSKHRKRVENLGCKIAYEFGQTDAAPRLDKLTRRVLALHDIEKYLFLGMLWFWFGVRKSGLRAQLARACFDFMNFVGVQILMVCTLDLRVRFLLNRRSNRDFRDKLARSLRIERIADCLDRNTDPTYELEFGQRPTDISNYLKDRYELIVANQYRGSAVILHRFGMPPDIKLYKPVKIEDVTRSCQP